MATQQQAQRAYDSQPEVTTEATIAQCERLARLMNAIEDDAEALRDILANCDLTWLTEAVVQAMQSPDRNAFWQAVIEDGMGPLIRDRAKLDLAAIDNSNAEAASERRGWARQAVLS
ncbi:hypothetical protein [Lysobacter capsici]|uniref:hypothetical protein n=1 Tax=Lysobacter capsici TaxID=435897 RepID=UPI00287BAC7F|nr:hypothetical protein [Lysobacter capsici]WND79421.1 hypothetical protein RJ610_19270 [Lysobacter capsici]WND84617.1 hypothetical protein RJ609_19285 [Lysobacter capsici]